MIYVIKHVIKYILFLWIYYPIQLKTNDRKSSFKTWYKKQHNSLFKSPITRKNWFLSIGTTTFSRFWITISIIVPFCSTTMKALKSFVLCSRHWAMHFLDFARFFICHIQIILLFLIKIQKTCTIHIKEKYTKIARKIFFVPNLVHRI